MCELTCVCVCVCVYWFEFIFLRMFTSQHLHVLFALWEGDCSCALQGLWWNIRPWPGITAVQQPCDNDEVPLSKKLQVVCQAGVQSRNSVDNKGSQNPAQQLIILRNKILQFWDIYMTSVN